MNNDIAEVEALTERVFTRAESLDNPELQADLARYLCVLVCGYLEQAVRLLLAEHARCHSEAPTLVSFVTFSVDRPQNLKKERLIKMLTLFSESWGKGCRTLLDERRASAVGSVYAQRDRVAHGASSDVTLRQARDYFVTVREVVAGLDAIVAGATEC